MFCKTLESSGKSLGIPQVAFGHGGRLAQSGLMDGTLVPADFPLGQNSKSPTGPLVRRTPSMWRGRMARSRIAATKSAIVSIGRAISV